ncbi:MAG: Ig-like domain-containing protein, partial [Oscillospiraceae bacterium]|nr:Ig-like domain-containing protein [Oscillospiraceae bacterium]
SVSWNGRVTAISGGPVTVTATIEGVGEQKCIVRCQFSGSASSSSGSGSGSSSSNGITLSREDFTLEVGESWRLTVSGTTSTVTWSSSNESVATVSSNGTVTNVGKGTCTVTAEVDGVKLSCIVRCKGN